MRPLVNEGRGEITELRIERAKEMQLTLDSLHNKVRALLPGDSKEFEPGDSKEFERVVSKIIALERVCQSCLDSIEKAQQKTWEEENAAGLNFRGKRR